MSDSHSAVAPASATVPHLKLFPLKPSTKSIAECTMNADQQLRAQAALRLLHALSFCLVDSAVQASEAILLCMTSSNFLVAQCCVFGMSLALSVLSGCSRRFQP